jgi:hypothetical protein
MHTGIHASCGIRTHDPSVRAGEDSSCLIPHGHCERRGGFSLLIHHLIQVGLLNRSYLKLVASFLRREHRPQGAMTLVSQVQATPGSALPVLELMAHLVIRWSIYFKYSSRGIIQFPVESYLDNILKLNRPLLLQFLPRFHFPHLFHFQPSMCYDINK